MTLTREDALNCLRRASILASTVRVDLDAAYLDAIAAIEALDANRTGADKTWIWPAQDAFRQHYRSARLT